MPEIQELSFSNTKDAFAYKTDKELFRARFLFSSMGNPVLLSLGLNLIPKLISWHMPFAQTLIRKTIFAQFVGGKTLSETEPLTAKMAAYGVATVIDYGVEGKTDGENALDEAAKAFINVITHAAQKKEVPAISIKATGFIRNALLEKVDTDMRMQSGDILDRYHQAIGRLDENEKQEWGRAFRRFSDICKSGFDLNVSVWVDAEETWMQEPVDAMAMLLMKECNKEKAVVYNTLQLYRHDRLAFLAESHRIANAHGFILGVKLVRGAYMEKERSRAQANGYASPIQPDKETCDRDYDKAVDFCLKHIDRVHMVVATHNENSTLLAARTMIAMGLSPDDSRVCFAQLLGMSDNITFNLAHHQFNAQKLVPFGPIKDVIPYLMRRAQENSSVKGQTGRELSLIKKEIARRRQAGN